MPLSSQASAYSIDIFGSAVSADGPAAGGHACGCGCPGCSGQVQVVEGPSLGTVEPLGPQAYLNADERSGASPNRKPNYTIDRAGLQLTGYYQQADGTLTPQPGW